MAIGRFIILTHTGKQGMINNSPKISNRICLPVALFVGDNEESRLSVATSLSELLKLIHGFPTALPWQYK